MFVNALARSSCVLGRLLILKLVFLSIPVGFSVASLVNDGLGLCDVCFLSSLGSPSIWIEPVRFLLDPSSLFILGFSHLLLQRSSTSLVMGGSLASSSFYFCRISFEDLVLSLKVASFSHFHEPLLLPVYSVYKFFFLFISLSFQLFPLSLFDYWALFI